MPVMADANGNILPDSLGITHQKRGLAELNQPQTEKPLHYTYLKEFRVEQCPLFLQHKCNQHRPYSCFHWHFLNQRRRRPKKKKDGTFNYSPDHYCTLYNETTGECPNGEECPYLHRVAGDVERRYHLRYYKTSLCVHETDSRGACVRNGAHCAFAHGPQDLRQPVYDIRELQMIEQEEKEGESKQVIPEDPRWNDTKYVLDNYKTEPCKKPPRLCRQGYACPQYHNNRDRRRSPRKYKYRSTPCPNVKHGDEWGDPAACENGDSCAYCHTRTEQQFHPEIYKSTKCNDMQQTGHCPRGPFCAFAHVEQDTMPIVNTVGSGAISIISDKELIQRGISSSSSQHSSFTESPLPSPAGLPQPISRPQRSMSASSGTYSSVAEHGLCSAGSQLSSSVPLYEKAPGSGRRSSSRDGDDRGLGMSQSSLSSVGSEPRTPSKVLNNQYYSSDTVDSVVGELPLDDFDLDKGFDETSSLGSSIGASTAFQAMNSLGSEPMSIPCSNPTPHHSSFVSQRSQSPTSPIGPVTGYYGSQGAPGSLRSPTVGGASSSFFEMTVQSPTLSSQPLTSPLGLPSTSDIQRLSEENVALKSKFASYEESWNQAKQACEAWKREATQLQDALKLADREKNQALSKLEGAENTIQHLKKEIEIRTDGGHLHRVKKVEDLEQTSDGELKQISRQLRIDVDKVEKVILRRESMRCSLCVENQRSVVTFPCAHLLMCDACAGNRSECPYCHAQISQKTVVSFPV